MKMVIGNVSFIIRLSLRKLGLDPKKDNRNSQSSLKSCIDKVMTMPLLKMYVTENHQRNCEGVCFIIAVCVASEASVSLIFE